MTESATDNLARTVRALRAINGWTQTDLARRSAIHRNYISAIERGTRNVGLRQIEKLAKAFGVPAYELIMPPGLERLDRAPIEPDKGVEETHPRYLC